MARISEEGFEELYYQLKNLEQDSVRRILKAGADAIAVRMRDVTVEHHHVVTGAMLRATEAGRIQETLEETKVEIYPGALNDFDYRVRFRNSSKAFVIEQGRGRKNKKKRTWTAFKNQKRDDFVTSEKLGYEQRAERAMLEENERIVNENN